MVYDIVPTIRAFSDCCFVNMVGGVHSQCHRQNSSVGGQGREGRREEGREAEIWKEEKREKGGREEGEKEGGRERKKHCIHVLLCSSQ